MTDDKAPEKTADDILRERCENFVKEFGELVGKHKIDFALYPMYVPDGSGSFKTVVRSTPIDITNQPVKSSVQPEDIIQEAK